MVSPRRIPVIVNKIIQHSEDTRTFELLPQRPIPIFRPGQFLHLTIDAYDPSSYWPDSRVFSIASSPLNKKHLIITISKKGYYTSRIFSELREGNEVWIKMPYGDLIIDLQHDNEIVLIAGGTGITPFISFIETLEYQGTNRYIPPVKLFYGARSSRLLIYKSKVELLKESLNDFKIYYSIQNPDGSENFEYFHGMLSIETILQNVDEVSHAIFYLSGPPEMIFSFKKDLSIHGVPKKHIRIDSWD